MPTHVHGELRKALKQFKDAQSTQEEKDATENIVIAIDGLIESKVAELLRVGRERKGRETVIGGEAAGAQSNGGII